MDSGQLDRNGKCVEELPGEQLFPPDSPRISEILADARVLPRVGSKYQAEIPPMLTESERLQLLMNQTDTEANLDVSHCFLVGLPVPVMWVDDKVNNHDHGQIGANKKPDDSVNANGSLGSKRAKKKQVISNKKALKSKALDVAFENGKKLKSTSSETAMAGKTNLDQICKSKSCSLVPGLLVDSSWTDVEVCGFVIALYIFEKNLVQVKRFLESKKMGDILSFYYGKFFGSDEHQRYLNCQRMMKSGKCIIGQRICTGWRQQVLLTRLLPHVPEEAKSTVVEVSRAFAEERISLEKYFHTLKTLAGTPILIEAIGIGKGKEDLITLAMEPTKNSQVFSVRAEIPVGKACSSLSSGDIIKFLTGDFRLSKARSNDIFWEAVWPRLLARGWHSEQLKNLLSYSSNHQLVFLVPGIKKFTRRKLVKGIHYFDSIIDVLSKVASEPLLIELETEDPSISSCKEPSEREPEPMLDHNGSDDHQPHRYLKPPGPKCSTKPTTFTIVDTSLSSEVKSLKVKGLRFLPADTKNTSTLDIHLTETVAESNWDSVDEAQSADMLSRKPKKIKFRNHAKVIVDNSNSNQNMPISGSEFFKKRVAGYQDHDTVPSNVEQSRTGENQFIRKVRPGCPNILPPVIKRRRLAPCVKGESSRSKGKFIVNSEIQVEPNLMSNSPDVSEAVPFHENVLLRSSSERSSTKKQGNAGILQDNMYGIEMSPIKSEKPQSRPLIDLNLPPVTLDSENGEFDVNDSLQNPNAHVLGASSDQYQLVEPKVLSTSIDANAAEKLPVMNPRRQSTRNRPLSMKALEAFASGFQDPKQRRRGREREMQSNRVRPSRRAHNRATVTSNSGSTSTRIVDDNEGNGMDGVWNGDKKRVRDPLFETELKAAQGLVEISKAVHRRAVQNCDDDLSGLAASAASGRVLSDGRFH